MGFETATALILRTYGYENVELGISVPFKKSKVDENIETTREIDVHGSRANEEEVYIIECKAETAGKPLDLEYINKFYTETVPAFLKAKYFNYHLKECKAEIWTTGSVSSEAKKLLESLSLKEFIKPRLLGRAEVLAEVPRKLSSCKRLINVISSC